VEVEQYFLGGDTGFLYTKHRRVSTAATLVAREDPQSSPRGFATAGDALNRLGIRLGIDGESSRTGVCKRQISDSSLGRFSDAFTGVHLRVQFLDSPGLSEEAGNT
jgi:hypothetical protein